MGVGVVCITSPSSGNGLPASEGLGGLEDLLVHVTVAVVVFSPCLEAEFMLLGGEAFSLFGAAAEFGDEQPAFFGDLGIHHSLPSFSALEEIFHCLGVGW